MTKIAYPPLPRLLCAAALLLAAGLAQAQYVWVDDKGVRHFSDRPPPPSTPADKVLKAPGKPSVAELLQDGATQPPAGDHKQAGDNKQAGGKPSLADREAEYRKRMQDRAKEEQKAAAQAKQQQAKAEHCADARRYKALLETGIRVAETDEKGERTYMSDEERAKRLAKAKEVANSCP